MFNILADIDKGNETYPPNPNTKFGFSLIRKNKDFIIDKKIFIYE